MRIIVLYIQYRDGVPEEDRRRLYQHARLSLAEIDAIKAIEKMGVKVGKVRYVMQEGRKEGRSADDNGAGARRP